MSEREPASLPDRERVHRTARIPGDGIGPEVLTPAWRILEVVGARHGFRLGGEKLPWGCDHYRAAGCVMPEGALDRLREFDAIFLGAVGSPEVAEETPIRGLILPIRQTFDQFVNLRPMRLLPGVASPLVGRTPADIDMLCIRENSEGEYVGVGQRHHRGEPEEQAEQTGIFTRRGIERVVRFAFEAARGRPAKRLASATKSNVLQHSMTLWGDVVDEVAGDYPDVEVRRYHVDALAARMVTAPESLDTIVASNLFGDILTDLGAAVAGSLGLAPSANLDPTGRYPSMFEPVHGSAPDIAGRGNANPIGAIWAGSLMLEHLGEAAAHRDIMSAIEATLRETQVRTPDLGGTASTAEMTEAVLEHLPGRT